MGKLGGYEYPDWTLTEIKRIAEIVEKKLQKEIKEEPLATLLGHKTARSGGYQTKLVALRRWGLSDGNRLTELAERLLHPRKGEEWQTVLECIKRVDLFWKLLQRNPERMPPKEGFWEELVAITGVDRSKAEKEAGKVLNIYKNAYDYLFRVKPEGVSMKEVIAGIIPERRETPIATTITPEARVPTIAIRPDMISLTFPLINVSDYEYAISTLEFLKRKKLEIEAKVSKKQEKEG